MNLKDIDLLSKIILVILTILLAYSLTFMILTSLLIPKQTSMMDMMSQMMRTDNIGFSITNPTIINLLSMVFAVLVGSLTSLYLFRTQMKEKEYEILRKALSEDEKKIFNEVRKAREITQDSLRFRLNWSKAKVPTILSNLDRRGIIQRERLGKTYKVYLQK
jgi:uncharacterized membrane protein